MTFDRAHVVVAVAVSAPVESRRQHSQTRCPVPAGPLRAPDPASSRDEFVLAEPQRARGTADRSACRIHPLVEFQTVAPASPAWNPQRTIPQRNTSRPTVSANRRGYLRPGPRVSAQTPAGIHPPPAAVHQ